MPTPAHSSNQIPPLDLTGFGVMKRLLSRVNHVEAGNIQSTLVAQGVSAFMSAACPINVVATFRNGGIHLAIEDHKLVCPITPEKAGCLLRPVKIEVESVRGETERDDEQMEVHVFQEACPRSGGFLRT
jgi:hypothetical protein